MTNTPAIDDLIDDFELLDDWEERYKYVIELGKTLPALSDTEKNDTTKVRGCVSQVWLVSELHDGCLHFRGESDAMIVQGLIAVLMKLFDGRRPEDILKTDALSVFKQMGFDEHLTPQRSNGLASMVQRIRHDAEQALSAA